eukprot:scaffold22622_cov137-Isochrysis_galbana.AAC.1
MPCCLYPPAPQAQCGSCTSFGTNPRLRCHATAASCLACGNFTFCDEQPAGWPVPAAAAPPPRPPPAVKASPSPPPPGTGRCCLEHILVPLLPLPTGELDCSQCT